jgi:hypothetical protein
MDVREKLVEIFCSVLGVEPDFSNAEAMEFVEELIANGIGFVTDNNVGSKWISVKECTPTEADGTVWVCLADVFPYNEKEPYIDAKHDRRITEAFYSQFSKRWYKGGAVFPDGIVTHWMEKPQPPKE